MAQHDYNISNQSFPSFRSDLNNALSAIQTCNSGTSRPTGAVSGQIWLDTTSATSPTLKYYDGADDISLATIDHTANTVNWLDSTVSITGLTTTATGTVLTLSDTANTSSVNLIIDNQKEVRFRETTANGTNYIGLKAPASVSADLTFTLPVAPTANNQALIASTAGVMSFTPYTFPSSDGSANQVLQTNGSGALSFATASGGRSAFRNIVINGDMQIAQRNTSVASITTGGYKTLDRFPLTMNSLGTWTMSQSTDVPSGYGFANSLKMDCTTADATPSAGDYLLLQHKIEAQNLQYLKKGTASAVSLTLSFWVKSTKTGTFIAELFDDNSRGISKSYTVNTTNTWEFKTVTFAGDTSGTIANTNGVGITLNFWLGAGTDFTSGTLNTSWSAVADANRAVGQVNIGDSTSNDWYITGVQLEAGTSATDFEFLPYDVSLSRCQRYYQRTETDTPQIWTGDVGTTALNYYDKYCFSKMRAIPSVTVTAGSISGFSSVLYDSVQSGTTYVAIYGTPSATGSRKYFMYSLKLDIEL